MRTKLSKSRQRRLRKMRKTLAITEAAVLLRPKNQPRRGLVQEERQGQAVPPRKSLEIVKLVAVHPRRSLRQHHWPSRQGIIHFNQINDLSVINGTRKFAIVTQVNDFPVIIPL